MQGAQAIKSISVQIEVNGKKYNIKNYYDEIVVCRDSEPEHALLNIVSATLKEVFVNVENDILQPAIKRKEREMTIPWLLADIAKMAKGPEYPE